MRTLPRNEQREYDAVDFAIRATKYNYANGGDRLKLIGLLYWGDGRLNIAGAASRIPCSVEAAKRWNSDFVQRVDMSIMVMNVRF